jgi:hypothetical protein
MESRDMPCLRPLVPASIVFAALASAAAAQPIPDREWKQLPSENFTIVGTASAEDLAHVGRELDTFCAVLQQVTPSLRLASPVTTYVVVLKDADEYKALQPRGPDGNPIAWAGGYFSASPDANYMVMPWWGNDRRAMVVLFHEFTHYVVERNVAGAPPWLSEGFSEFYSMFRVDASRNAAILGEARPDFASLLARRGPMPLRRLFAVERVAELSDDDLRLFYAQSWAFAHYILLGQENPPPNQIGGYLEAVARGEARDAAFARAFGGTFEAFGKALARYVQGARYRSIGLTPERPGAMAADASRVGPMPEADAAALQAAVLWRSGAVAPAEAALNRAVALQPSSLEARLQIDLVRRKLGWPADEAARYEQLAAMAAAAAAKRPLDAATQLHLSVAALAAGREAESEAALAAALRLNPDAGVHREHAYEAFAHGYDAVAARDVRAYFDRAGWAGETAQYMALLGALALRRTGNADEAARLLVKARAAGVPGAWTARLLDYMQGSLPADALLGAAKTDGERTEAHTYIGFEDVRAGRRDAAIAHFRWVKDKGSRNFVEFPIAVAELGRLEKAPSV